MNLYIPEISLQNSKGIIKNMIIWIIIFWLLPKIFFYYLAAF